jgi:hypothetical protein
MEDHIKTLNENQQTIGMVDNDFIAPLFGY